MKAEYSHLYLVSLDTIVKDSVLNLYCNSIYFLSDIHVTCLYSEECVLPCQSNLHDIIHWNKQEKTVHSFYHKQDQLGYQSEEYKGRTSLFSQSEINNGNVSLILKQIRIQDEGKYKCYAASDKLNDEKYVAVSVVGKILTPMQLSLLPFKIFSI